MVEIPQRADGSPVYRATYSLDDNGGWLVTVETERGEIRVSANRLGDIERRAYAAVRQHLNLDHGTFDVTFAHQIDLSQQSRVSH